MKLGIDAGHGGDDSGALDPEGRRESEFTLAVALCTASFARARGHQFHLSRSEDIRVPNRRRARAMNAADVDLVVSIHWNAAGISEANGTQGYYYRSSARGRELAELLVERVGALDGNQSERWERAIAVPDPNYRNGFVHPIIGDTWAPAVLLEVEFATNPGESWRLADPQYRTGVAEEIVRACEELLLEENDNGG